MFLFNTLYIYTLSFGDKQKTKHLEKQAKIRVSVPKARYDLILLSAGLKENNARVFSEVLGSSWWCRQNSHDIPYSHDS